MNVLKMTALELYERGLEALLNKLGAAETTRFLSQCKPGTGDYTADRHNWLKNEPIDTSVERLKQTRLEWREEERARARRFTASQSEMRDMTDIEIYEIGAQVLTEQLGVAGSIRFYLHHFKYGNHGDSAETIPHPQTLENRVKWHVWAAGSRGFTDSPVPGSLRARTATRKDDRTVRSDKTTSTAKRLPNHR